MNGKGMLAALVCVLCGAAPALADDQELLRESLRKWEKARDEAKGNYSYEVGFSSFTGFGHVTEIIVRDNKVAERRFREIGNQAPRPGKPGEDPEYKWVEKGKELGTHQEGAAVRTVDELYRDAAAILERERPGHEKLYLRFDKQGLLQSCFTVDTRLADDAPAKGVRIAGLALGGGERGQVHKAPNGKPFPGHWGPPPRIQTRDLRPLPGGYGRGSGTLAKWIAENLKRDAQEKGN